MSNLTLPAIPRCSMYIDDVMVVEWQDFFRNLYVRVGDYEGPNCQYASDGIERTTLSDVYVWDNNLEININVNIDDLIMVTLDGWFKNGSDDVSMGYIDLYSGDADRLTDIAYYRSQSRYYDSKSISMLYKAIANGALCFKMKFKSNIGQKIYASNRIMKAWMIRGI